MAADRTHLSSLVLVLFRRSNSRQELSADRSPLESVREAGGNPGPYRALASTLKIRSYFRRVLTGVPLNLLSLVLVLLQLSLRIVEATSPPQTELTIQCYQREKVDDVVRWCDALTFSS